MDSQMDHIQSKLDKLRGRPESGQAIHESGLSEKQPEEAPQAESAAQDAPKKAAAKRKKMSKVSTRGLRTKKAQHSERGRPRVQEPRNEQVKAAVQPSKKTLYEGYAYSKEQSVSNLIEQLLDDACKKDKYTLAKAKSDLKRKQKEDARRRKEDQKKARAA
jgi:hypothetical protein